MNSPPHHISPIGLRAPFPGLTTGCATSRRFHFAGLAVLGVCAITLFGILVTANSAGYRYGASDQAFYIPAVLRAITPALFPHDAPLFASQSRLTVSDELLAALARASGTDLTNLFLGGYVLTIVLLVVGAALVGSALRGSWWTTAALALALTLRHRIAGTGVNTFEGYFHPRVLAFAIGVLGVGALWHGRRWTAIAIVMVALATHPTTGLWFAIWILAALIVSSPRALSVRPCVLVGAAALGAFWALWRGPLAGTLVVMDPVWAGALAEKDYLFPTDWPADVWLINAIAPCALVIVYLWRRRLQLVTAAETGVLIGCFTLLVFFAATLPLVDGRVALAVQLQPSRALWPLDFLATAYLAWALVEAPWSRCALSHAVRSRAVVAALLAASLLRGAYVLRVEHSRPLARVGLPENSWQQTGDWAERHTPLDAHFLVDPDHALKYGTSFRVAARRDVFLESTKDTAMSTYSRQMAARVRSRLRELANFPGLTEERAIALAAAHDLDYLITERRLDLRRVYANDQFNVYSLRR